MKTKRILACMLTLAMIMLLVPSFALEASAATTTLSPVLKTSTVSQETPDDVTLVYEFRSSSWYPTNGTTYKLYADADKTTEAGSVELVKEGDVPKLNVTLNEAPVRDTMYFLAATAPEYAESNTTTICVKVYRITSGFTFSYGEYTDISYVDFIQNQTTYNIVLPPSTADDALISVDFAKVNGASAAYSGDTSLTDGMGTITVVVASESPALSYTYTINFLTLKLDGEGTKENPYLLKSAADLTQLADCLNSRGAAPMDAANYGAGNFYGYYFKLTEDIDLDGIGWEPIGHSSSTYFAGNFDGDGHTVSNMTTSGRYSHDEGDLDCFWYNNAGLFGWYAFGSVENLTVDNADVTAIGQNKTSYAGGLIAVPYGCTVTDCHVKNSKIKSDRVPNVNSNFAGGVAGIGAGATFNKCSSVNNTVQGSVYVGGFIGSNDEAESQFTDCFVADSTIESVLTEYWTYKCDLGVFAGPSQDGDYILTNCFLYNCKTQVADGAIEDWYEQGLFSISDSYGAAKTTNCYYYTTQKYDTATVATAVAKTTTDFADGTVAALLNGERTGDNVVWYQGAKYPVLQPVPKITGVAFDDTSTAYNTETNTFEVSETEPFVVYLTGENFGSIDNNFLKSWNFGFIPDLDDSTNDVGNTLSVFNDLELVSIDKSANKITLTFPYAAIQTFIEEYGNFEGIGYVDEGETNYGTAEVNIVLKKQAAPSGGTTYYKLTFDTNGGGSISAVWGTYGKTIDLTDYTPTRDGYDFSGWYSDQGLTQKITEIKLNGNKTVYAGWTASNPFTDVSELDWFSDDVMFVYKNGFMLGTSGTTFSPNGNTSRAMVTTVLWRMEGSPEQEGNAPFTDTESDAWYSDAIKWAVDEGIAKGYGGGLFGPDDPVTREQLAAFFYRYAEYKGYDLSPTNDLSTFTDADSVSAWAQDAMKWAVGSGLITGRDDRSIDSQSNATRAEFAAILHRFIEKYGLEEKTTYAGLA